jgi:hypothetical protein
MSRLWISIALALAACSGDGSGLGGSDCELAASVSGAVTWTSSATPACSIPFGGDTGIEMDFLPLDAAITRFEVDVRDVREGETGDFVALVRVAADDGTFVTPLTCTVTITEHTATGESDEFSREFRVTGEGTCPAAATRDSDQATVDVAPFAFRFPARWAQP